MGKIKVEASLYEEYREGYFEARRESEARRVKLLSNVLDAFGIREAYPDISTTRKRVEVIGNSMNGITSIPLTRESEYTHIDYGIDRFEKDLEAAARAAKGSEALAKIQAALKGKK